MAAKASVVVRLVSSWLLIILLSGCSAAEPVTDRPTTTIRPDSATAQSVTGSARSVQTTTTSAELVRTPTTQYASASAPVPLPQLGPNHWLIQDWEHPDVIVHIDAAGSIENTLWEQDTGVINSFDSGHTVDCLDVDGDGSLDLVDVRFQFEGDLRNNYHEIRSFGGDVVSDTVRPVDGARVPDAIHEICGELTAGPFFRLTAMQWGPALTQAGFTDISGDHAIDPVWEAGAFWNGVEYWPLNLYQGDFRPEPNNQTELIECDLGGIEIPLTLPDDAQHALAEMSGC